MDLTNGFHFDLVLLATALPVAAAIWLIRRRNRLRRIQARRMEKVRLRKQAELAAEQAQQAEREQRRHLRAVR